MNNVKRTLYISLILILLLSSNSVTSKNIQVNSEIQSLSSSYPSSILVSTNNPFYSIISTPLACRYNETKQSLQPLLLIENERLSQKQIDFLSTIKSNTNPMSIGFEPNNYASTSLLGSPATVSYQIAKTYFTQCSHALILPYNQSIKTYTTSLIASPLASYLNMPILLYDTTLQNHEGIKNTLKQINATTIYVVGIIDISAYDDYEIITLQNNTHIQHTILNTIKNRFSSLNYVTITNPSDIRTQQIIEQHNTTTIRSLHHTSLYLFGKQFILNGTDTFSTQLSIPAGLHKLAIQITMKNKTSLFNSNDIPILLSAELTDPKGNVVAYSHSPGYEKQATYIETMITNNTGDYTLTVTVFHGYRGGYFSLRGISNVKTSIVINHQLDTLSHPHYPFVNDLSQNAAYLTSAHGGIIIANEQFSLTDESYGIIADHHGTGPWYEETLHEYNNEKVQTIINCLQENLTYAKTLDVLDGYINGSGWIALLGDTNMLPMFYYPGNQTHLAERGLPSDNPYSLDHQLSPGRIISYTAADASLLIARTFFYEQVCGPVQDQNGWHHKFNFVFGEGFGETGGIFHQIPYASTIESYGFVTTVYGDLRNSRQVAERLHVYNDTNFVEYLGHGDWFWFTPSIYGINSVGQAIGSVHVREWNIKRPNVFLSSACLMGRIDGVPPMMSITLSFLHAGSNAFIGATRETGREAGLTVLEDHLIIDDYSLGEALRGEKRVDKEKPTYYVRCLFGDPAFNPYDPLHGYSDQGMPVIR